MPEKTTNLNLPIPLGNENVNRQYFVDLIQAIDSGAVSEEQLAKAISAIKIELVDAFDSNDKQKAPSADALRRGLETKQNMLRLADNYLAASVLINASAADNGGKEYPNGVSMFKVSTSTAGWPAANGYVLTFRVDSGGYQVFYESYNGTIQTDKTARQWTRSKRDSNGFWQEWVRVLTEVDQLDYVRQPAYAVTTGTGAAYTVTLDPAPGALPDGFGITIVPHTNNTIVNPTLKIGALPAYPIKLSSSLDAKVGEIRSGSPICLRKVGNIFSVDGATALAFQHGIENKQKLVDTLNTKKLNVSTNDSWDSIIAKAGSLYGVGSIINPNNIAAPIIRPVGSSENAYFPSWNSTYFYSISGSYYQKYGLDGVLKSEFQLPGLNDSNYSTRGTLYPVPNSDYYYYKTRNSYDGDIRMGANGTGSTVFYQGGSQNSGGGLFGIIGVSQDGSLYYSSNTSSLIRTNGLTSNVKWSRNYKVYNNMFFPASNSKLICIGSDGTTTNNKIMVIDETNGNILASSSFMNDGSVNAALPKSGVYDYINNFLYLFLGATESYSYGYYILKKYAVNINTGVITLVTSYDLKAVTAQLFGSNNNSYNYTSIVGVLKDKLVLSIGDQVIVPSILLMPTSLNEAPVVNKLLKENYDILRLGVVQAQNDEKVLSPYAIIDTDLAYKVKA